MNLLFTLILAIVLAIGVVQVWKPNRIPNMILWLDASDKNTVTTNEKGEVLKWESKK